MSDPDASRCGGSAWALQDRTPLQGACTDLEYVHPCLTSPLPCTPAGSPASLPGLLSEACSGACWSPMSGRGEELTTAPRLGIHTPVLPLVTELDAAPQGQDDLHS